MLNYLLDFIKYKNILTSGQQREGLFLISLMVIGLALELLSIGLVLPIISFFIKPIPQFGSQLIDGWSLYSDEITRAAFIISAMGFLVFIFLVKVIFLGYVLWKQNGFVYGLQADLSGRLFDGYLRQPYSFHLQRNSAQLIQNVTTEVSAFAGLTQSFLTFLAEMLVCAGVLVILLFLEPIGTITVALLLGCAGWFFSRATKAHIISLGDARHEHEGLRIQHLQQGLGAIKDLKVLGRECEFLQEYQRHNLVTAHVSKVHQTLQQLPKYGLELMAVSSLAIIVIVMTAQDRSVVDILPVLGMFGVAAFRLMPAVNRIIVTAQTMRFLRPAVATLSTELSLFRAFSFLEPATPIKLSRELLVHEATFRYPGASIDALKNVSLRIAVDSTVGITGPSGSGKSTLVDLILGLLNPIRGCLVIDGVDIQTNLRGWQAQIGYVPQFIYLTDDSLRRNVAFGLPDDAISDQSVWRALAAAQLDNYVRSLPEGLDTRVGEQGVRLSGGQRQRIGISRALYHEPAILVLDEATSALDFDTEREVMRAIAALHGLKTVIIIAHRLTTLVGCDQVFEVIEGRLVDQRAASINAKLAFPD